MDDNSIFEKVKQAIDDAEKIAYINLIKNQKLKENAIILLSDDNDKMLLAETLEREVARARIYQKLIKNEQLVDTIIEKVNCFENSRYAVLVLSSISNTDVGKKSNGIANLLIKNQALDDDSREMIISYLQRIYNQIKIKNKEYSLIDFLSLLKDDYAISAVIANFPNDLEEKKSMLSIIKSDNIREQTSLIYSTREELSKRLDTTNISTLNLPPDMTIGVELEAEGIMSSAFNKQKICGNWQASGDASLQQGIEIVSPVLHDSLEDMTDLSMVCQVMKKCKLDTSDRCGGHIHIGANYLDTKEAFGNFLTLWLANEELIYQMCNASGENFRKDVDYYAKPVSLLYENGDENIFDAIANANTRDELVSIIQKFQKGHYNGLNTDNINEKEKNTIEFRMSNGTLNFDEIQNNIRLYGRLMQRSKELAQIQEKINSDETISDIEQQKLSEFDILCGQQSSDSRKEQILIDFLFEENEKEIYNSRYNSSRENSEPLKKMFSKDAYKKLYTTLKPKEKNFSSVLEELKDSRTNELEGEDIEQ